PANRTPGCIRYEIGTCMGPCIGACTGQRYNRRVHAAKAFLAGTNTSILAELQTRMEEASAYLDFERAALLRDKLESLRCLHEQLDRLRRLRDHEPFIYRVAHQVGEVGYLIEGGRVLAVARISPDSPAKNWDALLKKRGSKDRALPENPDELLLLAA